MRIVVVTKAGRVVPLEVAPDAPMETVSAATDPPITRPLMFACKVLRNGSRSLADHGARAGAMLREISPRLWFTTRHNRHHCTPLMHAASKRRLDVLTLLLRYHAEVATVSRYRDRLGGGYTVYHMAARKGDMEVLEILLRHWPEGAMECDSRSVLLLTPFHEAVTKGDREVLELLLRYCPDGAQVRGRLGRTPFHVATEKHDLKMLTVLLNYNPEGAFVCDAGGRTPFHLSTQMGHGDVLQLLLQRFPGAMQESPPERRVEGPPCLISKGLHHIAAALGNWQAMQVLLWYHPRGAMERDVDGSTPFHVAVQREHGYVLQLLLQRCPEGALLKDARGRTPVDVAKEMGNTEALELLMPPGPAEHDNI